MRLTLTVTSCVSALLIPQKGERKSLKKSYTFHYRTKGCTYGTLVFIAFYGDKTQRQLLSSLNNYVVKKTMDIKNMNIRSLASN